MNKELRDLYIALDELAPYRRKIEEIEGEISRLKEICTHEDNAVLKEGTEFDGYDRNEYFAEILCHDCGEIFYCYDKSYVHDTYNFVDGMTKLNCRI